MDAQVGSEFNVTLARAIAADRESIAPCTRCNSADRTCSTSGLNGTPTPVLVVFIDIFVYDLVLDVQQLVRVVVIIDFVIFVVVFISLYAAAFQCAIDDSYAACHCTTTRLRIRCFCQYAQHELCRSRIGCPRSDLRFPRLSTTASRPCIAARHRHLESLYRTHMLVLSSSLRRNDALCRHCAPTSTD